MKNFDFNIDASSSFIAMIFELDIFDISMIKDISFMLYNVECGFECDFF
jgi:hypothetical protein